MKRGPIYRDSPQWPLVCGDAFYFGNQAAHQARLGHSELAKLYATMAAHFANEALARVVAEPSP